MKREAILDFYIFNGKEHPTKDMTIFDEITSLSIYEVIRLIDFVPLFLEEHLNRMRKSAKLLGYEIHKSDQEIIEEIFTLAQLNRCGNMNVKLICSNLDCRAQNFLTYFIQSHYPKREVYEKGVYTILYHSERENPNIKTLNINLRERVNAVIQAVGAYEALLVNKEGYITEGSRSNVFFVKGDLVYTAPAREVLMGVTRIKILKICEDLNIKVIEKAIHKNDIMDMEGAFITGTSIDVLPISKIDTAVFASVKHPIIEKIALGYEAEKNVYLSQKKAR